MPITQYSKQRNKEMVAETPQDFKFSEPLRTRFTQEVMSKANMILAAFRFPRMNLPRPSFWDDAERILTYELVVNVIKYQPFIEDTLFRSQIFTAYPEILEFGEEEVNIVVYDMMERGFGVCPEDPELTGHYKEMQDAVIASKTKIMAHMARLRIRSGATRFDHLLPENLRHQTHIDKNPLYAWVNLKKISMFEIKAFLELGGYTQARCVDDILIQTDLFAVDENHPDLLRFHSDAYDRIQQTYLIKDGRLIVQDKSACIYVYALVKALYFKAALTGYGSLRHINSSLKLGSSVDRDGWYEGIWDVNDKTKPECVIVTHCGSGRSAAHLAMLLAEAVPKYVSRPGDIGGSSEGNLASAISKKFMSRPPLTVIVFGVPYHKMDEVARSFRKYFSLPNVRLYAEEFSRVAPTDQRIKGAIAILVNPPSTGTAIKDLVSYVCTEGGDESVLAQMRKFLSNASSEEKIRRYTKRQNDCLKLALSFVDVKLILYTTCSNIKHENIEVVKSSLSRVRLEEEKRRSQVIQDILSSRIKTYRATTFELVDLREVMDGYDDTCFTGRYIDVPPNSASSGVFVALVRRRDLVVPLNQDPIQTFIYSQLLVTPKGLPSSLKEISPSSSSSNISVEKKKLPRSLEDWKEYFLTEHQMDISEHLKPGGYDHWRQAVGASEPRCPKRAVVDRLSTPTYASLSRQTGKWVGGTSTTETKASKSGRKPFGNITLSAPCTLHNCYNCVCARHAKNFPDLFEKKQ